MRQQPFASPEEALKHHGVKGQKWGVVKKEDLVGKSPAKKPPINSLGKIGTKPVAPVAALSKKDQARVDKFLKRADVMSTKASELKVSNEALKSSQKTAKAFRRYANNETIRNNEQYIKSFEAAQKRAIRDAEAVQKGKLTSTQKKVIIGAVGVTAILGVVAISKGQQSGALNSYKLRGLARLRGQKIPFNVNEELRKPMGVSDLLNKVAKPVNPGYSSAGGQMNCRRCTFAYELRRRGLDVHATTSAVGWGQSESGVINALTPGSDNFYRSMSMSTGVVESGFSTVARGDKRALPVTKILLDGLKKPESMFSPIGATSSSAKVLEELAKQPNGARGEVVFKFPSFGHSMAYEVVDGVPHIFDSQKGTLYNAATKMVESKWDGFSAAEITRLDNVDLDVNFLTRWATNVGGK